MAFYLLHNYMDFIEFRLEFPYQKHATQLEYVFEYDVNINQNKLISIRCLILYKVY